MSRPPARHGTRTRYQKHRCRCGPCVQANRDYSREYMRLYRQGLRLTDPWIEEALRA